MLTNFESKDRQPVYCIQREDGKWLTGWVPFLKNNILTTPMFDEARACLFDFNRHEQRLALERKIVDKKVTAMSIMEFMCYVVRDLEGAGHLCRILELTFQTHTDHTIFPL